MKIFILDTHEISETHKEIKGSLPTDTAIPM
jgi:hypothetical protein